MFVVTDDLFWRSLVQDWHLRQPVKNGVKIGLPWRPRVPGDARKPLLDSALDGRLDVLRR